MQHRREPPCAARGKQAEPSNEARATEFLDSATSAGNADHLRPATWMYPALSTNQKSIGLTQKRQALASRDKRWVAHPQKSTSRKSFGNPILLLTLAMLRAILWVEAWSLKMALGNGNNGIACGKEAPDRRGGVQVSQGPRRPASVLASENPTGALKSILGHPRAFGRHRISPSAHAKRIIAMGRKRALGLLRFAEKNGFYGHVDWDEVRKAFKGASK